MYRDIGPAGEELYACRRPSGHPHWTKDRIGHSRFPDIGVVVQNGRHVYVHTRIDETGATWIAPLGSDLTNRMAWSKWRA
jgi:hypothetical protein